MLALLRMIMELARKNIKWAVEGSMELLDEDDKFILQDNINFKGGSVK